MLEITIFATKIDFFFAAKKPPYLGPQSPYQKLQLSLFHSKLISHVWYIHRLARVLMQLKSSTRKVWFLLSDQWQTWAIMWRHLKISNLQLGKSGFSYLSSDRLEPLCGDISNLPWKKSGFSYLTSGRLEPLCGDISNLPWGKSGFSYLTSGRLEPLCGDISKY